MRARLSNGCAPRSRALARRLRDLPFATRVSDSLTLSTFHGCPPDEIEDIVCYLLGEFGLDVVVKLNPTLLGREEPAPFSTTAWATQGLLFPIAPSSRTPNGGRSSR